MFVKYIFIIIHLLVHLSFDWPTKLEFVIPKFDFREKLTWKEAKMEGKGLNIKIKFNNNQLIIVTPEENNFLFTINDNVIIKKQNNIYCYRIINVNKIHSKTKNQIKIIANIQGTLVKNF